MFNSDGEFCIGRHHDIWRFHIVDPHARKMYETVNTEFEATKDTPLSPLVERY